MISRYLDPTNNFRGPIRAVLIFLLIVWVSHYLLVELGDMGRSGEQLVKTDSFFGAIIQVILSIVFYIILIIPGLIYSAIRWIYSPDTDFSSHNDPVMIYIVGSLVVLYAVSYFSNKSSSLTNIRNTKNKKFKESTQNPSSYAHRDEYAQSGKANDKYMKNIYERDPVMGELKSLYNKTAKNVKLTNNSDIYLKLRKIDENIYRTMENNLFDQPQTWYVFCSDSDFDAFISKTRRELNELNQIAEEFIREARENAQRQRDNSRSQITKEKAFQLFELKTTASREEIRAKYKELVMKFNTDHRADLEEHIKELLDDKMKEINVARDFFRDNGYI